MPIVTITCFFIYQTIAKMNLIVFNVLIRYIEEYFIIRIPDTHIGAHLAGVTAHTWSGELDPCGYVPAFRGAGGQREAAADSGHAITAGGGQQLQG